MLKHEYTSSSNNLSFCVAFHPKKHKICGLNVSCIYKLYKPVHDKRWCFFIKISNITKGVTWFYNPIVYCKPEVDENVLWLSYWPIGNIVDTGDEFNIVFICLEEGMIVSGCGASLVYIDDGKAEQEAKRETKSIEMEEVIGGDLSEFEVSTGVYYLCRHDFFKCFTQETTKSWVGDGIPYEELQRWRKSYQLLIPNGSCMKLNYAPDLHRDTLFKRISLGYFNRESDIRNIKKAVYGLVGVDIVLFEASPLYTDKKTMYVFGSVDSTAVLTCVRVFEKTVSILYVYYSLSRHLKLLAKISGRIDKHILM